MASITLNGKQVAVESDSLSYEDIIALAGEQPGATVVYHKKTGGDSQRQGILSAGKSVGDVDGMHIDAIMTGNA